ncbi:hypothetical protein DOY81_012881, partial [Sarcophaga bullata]
MSRTIHAGELLTTMNDNGKVLQCKNIKDEIINLPLDTKAKFSPIAKEDSISGVHTVKNLLLKRMPVVVRLVHGSVPKGLKQPFVAEMRLLGCVEIDRIFALPLQKDNDLVPVPLNAKIKLQRAKNMDQLEHFIEYTRFLEKAQRLLSDARDRLQIVDIKLSEKEKKDSKFSSRNKLPVVMLPSAAGVAYVANGLLENGYILKRSASCDSYTGGTQMPHHSHHSHHHQNHSHNHPTSSAGGGIVNHYQHSHVQEDIKPVPPPIETIPGKKLPEKRQRPTLPKLYLKNSHSAGSSSGGGGGGGSGGGSGGVGIVGNNTNTTNTSSSNGSHHQQQQHSHHQTHHPSTHNHQASAVNVSSIAAVATAHHHAHHHHHHHHHGSSGSNGRVLTPSNHHHTPYKWKCSNFEC